MARYEPMPVAGVNGWEEVSGSPLIVLFNSDGDEKGDGVSRPTVVVGVLGKPHKILELEMFTSKSGRPGHVHILPTGEDEALLFLRRRSESDVVAALRFFEMPNFLKGLLDFAGEAAAAYVSELYIIEMGRRIRALVE